MIYRAIGLMSGSSLDGLDIAFVELQESGGTWRYTVKAAGCFAYEEAWITRLRHAAALSAAEYQLLHVEYGHYTGQLVNRFIEQHALHYQVQLVASHGHTVFHAPAKKMTAQLGDGAAIAAVTGINVVSDLRAMDVALGGQGAPIVPIGEKLLLGDYSLFLNIGGIANISYNHPGKYIAFDVCPANRVLNMLAAEAGQPFDDGGRIAASGTVQPALLDMLNTLEYYQLPYPKSLSNDFGTQVVYPLVNSGSHAVNDRMRTYVEHIAIQVSTSIKQLLANHKPASNEANQQPQTTNQQLLITGGGAHHHFLIERIQSLLQQQQITVVVPDKELVDFKEAIIMALVGVLRWREENNVLASVTGASRNSIGGAVWIGLEA